MHNGTNVNRPRGPESKQEKKKNRRSDGLRGTQERDTQRNKAKNYYRDDIPESLQHTFTICSTVSVSDAKATENGKGPCIQTSMKPYDMDSFAAVSPFEIILRQHTFVNDKMDWDT